MKIKVIPITLDVLKEATCPKCGSENFARPSDGPLEQSDWYGDLYFEVNGPNRINITQARCGKCGHIEPVTE